VLAQPVRPCQAQHNFFFSGGCAEIPGWTAVNVLRSTDERLSSEMPSESLSPQFVCMYRYQVVDDRDYGGHVEEGKLSIVVESDSGVCVL
jgi:hypothetical protein